MPYSTTNPPFMIAGGISGGARLWFYRAVDAPALIRVNGYFTNGFNLGMRTGDVVFAVDTDAAPLSMHVFIVNQATAALGVDVSDGLAITATDTD